LNLSIRLTGLLLALTLVLVAGRALAQDAADPASGEDLYRRYCSSCHGIDGKGDGPVAPVLKEKPKDLTRIAQRRDGVFPAAAIVRIVDGRDVAIAHGTREMPVWAKRFGEALAPGMPAETVRRGTAQLIVDYLGSIQVKEAPPARK
jgi:mono/diheme cytochrome c family protein